MDLFDKKKKKQSSGGGKIVKERTSNSAMGVHTVDSSLGMSQMNNEFQNHKQYMKTGFKGQSPTIQKNMNGSIGSKMIKTQ